MGIAVAAGAGDRYLASALPDFQGQLDRFASRAGCDRALQLLGVIGAAVYTEDLASSGHACSKRGSLPENFLDLAFRRQHQANREEQVVEAQHCLLALLVIARVVTVH